LSISHIGHSRLAGPMHSLALKKIPTDLVW
jgi:hypothetical protein